MKTQRFQLEPEPQTIYHINMNRLNYLVVILFSLITGVTQAFPQHNPVPGGTAVVKLSSTGEKPAAFYKKLPVAVQRHNGSWYAFIGLSLNTKPGGYKVMYRMEDNKPLYQSFTVNNKIYEAQYLTIKNKRKVNPYAKDMDRILAEKKIKAAAKRTWSDIPVKSDFIRPLHGRTSSIFGLRRFFNDQARRPHSGLDIAAPEGTPVKAIADATVIETGNFFFSGNMIYLDHGQGVISLYAHLHKVHVSPGQKIRQGEIIGEVGETGRVTGPHLHMSLLLNQTAVDPDHWLPAAKAH